MEFWLRYDLRSPAFGTSTADIIQVALEQVEWADSRGFHTVSPSEHHASPDGYNPSPLVLAGAIAARTSRMRIHPPLIVTLYDPVKLAEDCCILDHACRGRLDLTIVIGYVPAEFALFGLSKSRRGQIADEKLAAIEAIFAGRPFEYHQQRGRVTPLPYQPGGPRMFIGGETVASARRAARFGHGYNPMVRSPELLKEYERACAEYGKKPGRIIAHSAPVFFHVAEDPDRAWAQIAPHAMHEANAYSALAAAVGQESPFPSADTPQALRATGAYRVMTPEECIAYCRSEHEAGRNMYLSPMMGGLSPELAWSNLELFASKVIPTLRKEGILTEPDAGT